MSLRTNVKQSRMGNVDCIKADAPRNDKGREGMVENDVSLRTNVKQSRGMVYGLPRPNGLAMTDGKARNDKGEGGSQ